MTVDLVTINCAFHVFLGCGLNAIFLELLVQRDPGVGNLVTFLQFLFIAIYGFVVTMRFGRRPLNIPLRAYSKVTLLFFMANLGNNLAFKFKISMPLHMIFRSGSLITNMLLSVVMLKSKYSVSKYISVIMITIGVAICTIISSPDKGKSTETEAETDFFQWTLGIIILIVSLLISSMLGIYQQLLYSEHGKHPEESLFFTHLFALPMFLTMYENMIEHAKIAWNDEHLQLPLLSVTVPALVAFLIGNVLTQYLCISAVYRLSSENTAFVTTLIITLRKFASLIFSIVYFQNPFTLMHWVATILVFVGTLIFTEIPQKLMTRDKITASKKAK